MGESIQMAPWSCWACLAVMAILIAEGYRNWNQIWAKPTLVVYTTLAIWYPGDYFLSEFDEYLEFDPSILELSFIQVTLCFILLRLMFPFFVAWFTRELSATRLCVVIPNLWLWLMLKVSIAVWIFLLLIATFRLSSDPLFLSKLPSIIWPPLYPTKVGMFSHTGLGDSYSFLWASLGYIQRLVCAIFGVIFVLSNGRTRALAIVMILLAWPYIFFDRARNIMLLVLLPAVAAYWIGSKHKYATKVLTSLGLMFALSVWFKLVLAYREEYTLDRFDLRSDVSTVKHYGLDMLKELCFVNKFIANGSFLPNWGYRYFAEAVNFVPRAVWKGKPTIGIDYSLARGFGEATSVHGVEVTVATGIIGQGIVNFGQFFGVVAVAILLSIWIGFLTRLWLQSKSPPRFLLFLIGMGVTFNCGRDITLLVLFPFLFGYIFVRLFERWNESRSIYVRPTFKGITHRG